MITTKPVGKQVKQQQEENFHNLFSSSSLFNCKFNVVVIINITTKTWLKKEKLADK